MHTRVRADTRLKPSEFLISESSQFGLLLPKTIDTHSVIQSNANAVNKVTHTNVRNGFRQGGRRGKPQAYSLLYVEDFPRSPTQYKGIYCVCIRLTLIMTEVSMIKEYGFLINGQ